VINNGRGELLMGNLKSPGILGPFEPEKSDFLSIKITSRHITLSRNFDYFNNINKLCHSGVYISLLFSINIQI
jgi:hypothetical protein